jgi:prevent-host-death family protein
VEAISWGELQSDSDRVLDSVARGERFVITSNGVPVADLTPVRTTRRRLVPTAELVALFRRGPHIDRQWFRTDIDRVIDPRL